MVDFKVTRLEPEYQLPPFDCGVEDINAFLVEDAKDYQEGLFAVTYIATNPNNHDLISYFCLLNDKLAYLPGEIRNPGISSTGKSRIINA